MKKFSLKSILGLALLVFVFVACEDDPIGGGGTDPIGGATGPTLSILSESGFVSTDATVSPNEDFTVKISVNPGDADLRAFYLEEDGLNIENSRFSVNGTAAASNPVLILGTDVEGLTWEITVSAHDAPETRSYTFIVDDVDQLSSSETLNITTGGGLPPVVELGISGMFEDVEAGALVKIPVTVAQGSFALSSIAVYQDNELITDVSRLYYGDTSVNFDDNPQEIPAEDKFGFQKDIYVRAQEEAGTSQYTIILSDEFGESTSSDFSISTNPVGTPLTNEFNGVLFNAAGPAGTGGLDLDEGLGTGSSSALAEIKDNGIDQAQPAASNWVKTITGINGTTVKLLIPGLEGVTEGFSFAGVTNKEQITELASVGTAFQNTNASGELMSFLVEVGDIFVAIGTNETYLFEVVEVNETTDNNDDNYVFNIKF